MSRPGAPRTPGRQGAPGPRGPSRRPAPPRRSEPHAAPARPLNDRELDELQARLDALPAPLEPLDLVALDGFLCGVLLQPETVPPARWLAHVFDAEARPVPAGHDTAPLAALVRRRHAELAAAIGGRRWFDPWVFEVDSDDEDAGAPTDDDEEPDAAAIRAAVFPWVAGIAAAFELFPGVMDLPPEDTLEPLALIYRHLDPDDLEDADELLAEIESIEPPSDLTDAVEGLVRATLLLADAVQAAGGAGRR